MILIYIVTLSTTIIMAYSGASRILRYGGGPTFEIPKHYGVWMNEWMKVNACDTEEIIMFSEKSWINIHLNYFISYCWEKWPLLSIIINMFSYATGNTILFWWKVKPQITHVIQKKHFPVILNASRVSYSLMKHGYSTAVPYMCFIKEWSPRTYTGPVFP